MASRFQVDFQALFTVKAAWDAEAEVWYTEFSSLPGLNLEAETIDALRGKLPGAVEDLLEAQAIKFHTR